MVLATKDSNGIATQAQGAFANCGPGSNGYELSYSCQGPACLSLDSSFQNVICHKDGRNTLICSNDVKCKPGASAYQSNFTFSQNEPDPWSPVMDNKPDIWVPQDQHILVGGCARFSVSSDGTKQGTKVNDEGQDDVCRGVQMFSTAGGHAGQISTATGHPQAGATQKPLVFQGRGQRRSITKPTLLFALLLSFVLLVHRAEASALHHHHIEPRRRSDVRTRQTSDSVKAFAEDLRADIARKASRQGADGETYAQSLVTNVVSSVCQDHFDGSPPGTFSHEIVRDCVASTYGNDRLPQPALQFLAIFGATLLCDYVISETYPSGQEFQPNGCEGLQDFVSRDQAGASPTSSTKQTSRQMLSTSTQLPVATTDAGTLGTLNQGSTSYATASPEAALSKLSSINVLTTNKLETDLTLSDEQTTLGSLPVIHLAPTAPSLPPLSIESSLKPSSFQPDTSTPAFSQKLSVTSASDATSATGIFSGGLLSTHALGAGPTVEILDIGSQAPSLVATLPSAQAMLPQPLVETQEDASLQSNVVGMPFLTDSMSRIPVPVTTSSTQTSASSLGVFAVSQDVTHSAASSGPIATTTTTMQFASMTDLSTTLLGTLRSKISPTLGLAWNTPWSDSPFSSVFETMAVDPEASSITTSNAVTLDKSPSFTVAHLSKTQGSSSLIESVFPQDGSQRLTASIPASATSIATIDNAPSVLVPDEQQPSTSVPMNTDDAGFAKSIAMASSPERLSITTSGVQQDVKPSTMKSTNSITTTTPESVSVASSGMIAALRSSASDMSTTSAALVTVPQNLKQGVPVVTVKPVSSQSVSTSAPPSALPTYLTYMSVEVIDHLGATSNESPLAMLSLDPSKLSSTIPASTTGTKVSLRVGSPIVAANALPSGPTGENSLPGPSQPADPTPTSAGSTIAEAGSTPGSSMAYLGFSTHALNGAVQASSSFSPTFSISLSHHIATLLASSSSPASSRSSWLSNNETFFANSEPTSDRSTIRPNRSSTIASSVVLSTLIASPTSGRSIAPIAVRPSTTVEGLSTITPTPAVHSTSVFKPTSSNSSTHTILTQICLPSSSTPDFCSGSGCVSLMKDNAHCGACNRVCEHECYQGVCVCPDFTTPNTNNECVERSGLDLCVNGYAQNVFRICAPSATSSQLKASALVAPQRSLTRTTTPILTTARPAVSRFSLANTVATQSTTESLYCPPALPDICDGGCFNTKTERNHCGGCGRLCSGECIDNHCVASSTQSRAQPTSTGRTVLTSNPPIASVVHVAVTSTVEPVVMYIMKGLAGPQQA